LAGLAPNADTFRQHNALKADRTRLPRRAEILHGGGQPDIWNLPRADIARFVELSVFVSVNFDPGAGLLTALGLYIRFRPYRAFGAPPVNERTIALEQFVISDRTAVSEREAVQAFLMRLSRAFALVATVGPEAGGPEPQHNRTQMYFWDARQFEELCRAIGRHLGAILETEGLRGLAWLFPPDELLPDPNLARAPTVVFVRSVVSDAVALNVPHAYTLFGVVQQYSSHPLEPLPDNYFCDPLSDMIPRERIYEIWGKAAAPIHWQRQLERYRLTVRLQVRALSLIVWRLRSDLTCQAQAAVLNLRGLTNYQRLSPDSRVWYAWTLLEDNLERTEQELQFAGDPEKQEGAYTCVRLLGLESVRPDGALVFRVAGDSLNAKITDGESFLALRNDDVPGFLNTRLRDVPRADGAGYAGNWHSVAQSKLAYFFGGTRLLEFDRRHATATVELDNWGSRATVRQYLDQIGAIDYSGNWSLIPGPGVDRAPRLRKVLDAIGNPRIAVPHPSTLLVYGQTTVPRPGSSQVTPAARVLWDAAALAREPSGIPEEASRVIVEGGVGGPLNASQRDAVVHALTRRLSVLWGPPGTGKTSTLAALIVARLLLSQSGGRPVRILVSGPTYKALGEVIEKVIQRANAVPELRLAALFRVFAAAREVPVLENEPDRDRIQLTDVRTSGQDPGFNELIRVLGAPERPLVAFVPPRQCRWLTSANNSDLAPLFDLCLIDESSQVTVADAILAFAAITADASVVILGDIMQMAPVTRADAPTGAAFLVGTIQRYLTERHQVEQQMLMVNYRSSKPFVEYARILGYDRRLTAHSERLQLALADGWQDAWPPNWPPAVHQDAWLSTALDPSTTLVSILHRDGRSGQHNPFEAQMTAAMVAKLRRCAFRGLANRLDPDGHVLPVGAEVHTAESFWRDGVGIVTPHRSQRVAICEALKQIFPDDEHELIDEAVDTVERFQGGERDVVVVSFGIGDPDLIADEEEFLLQLERTNVAVSRARAKCVVLISRELAYHLPEDKRVVDTAKAIKSFLFDVCTEMSRVHIGVAGEQREAEIRVRAL
jgi:hypothetical protein